MSGRSGTRTASHTPLLGFVGHPIAMVVTAKQRDLVRRAKAAGGSLHIMAAEVRTARSLVKGGWGTLTDDGAMRPGTNADGERWTFAVVSGVVVIQ